MQTAIVKSDRTRWQARVGLAFALAAAGVALAFSGGAQAGMEPTSAEADASRPFVVKISADWCGTCTRLEPVIEALEEQQGSKARVVVLDVTDKAAVLRSSAEAERLGLGEFFASYKSRTGTVGVLRGDNREVVSVMKGEMDLAAYEAAIDEARG